jgi:hypothetical protein
MATVPRYSPSGFLRPITVALFAGATLAGVVLAWPYQLLLNWIPLVYLNLITVVGFGLGLGALGSWAVRRGHCRNRAVALLLALPLFALPLAMSYYVGYRGTVSEVQAAHPEVSREEIMRDHLTFADWLKVREEAGWSLKSSKVDGGMVLVIWAAEALWLLGVIGWLVLAAAGAPYCERCNRFCAERKLRVPGRSRKEALALVEGGDLDALIGLQPPSESDGLTALLLTGAICGGCAETGFLTVEEKLITVKRGKREEKSKRLLSNAILRADQRATFLARLDDAVPELRTAPPAA